MSNTSYWKKWSFFLKTNHIFNGRQLQFCHIYLISLSTFHYICLSFWLILCLHTKKTPQRYFSYLFPQAESNYGGNCHTQNKSLESTCKKKWIMHHSTTLRCLLILLIQWSIFMPDTLGDSSWNFVVFYQAKNFPQTRICLI